MATARTATALEPSPVAERPRIEVSHAALIGAIEAFWIELRDGAGGAPDLPIVTFTIGGGSDPRHPGLLKAGHFHAERWNAGRKTAPIDTSSPSGVLAARLVGIAKGTGIAPRPIHEVFVAGERLADGARGVLATVTHEAAHALALARGIRDVSRNARYHNGHFRDLAQAFGLVVAQVPVIGWSATSWTEEMDQRYSAHVSRVEAAITGWRVWDGPTFVEAPTSPGQGETDPGEEGGEGVILVGRMPAGRPTRPAGRLLATCECGRGVRVAAGVLALGPITCGLCGRPFVTRDAS
jgi:hypothetical protein